MNYKKRALALPKEKINLGNFIKDKKIFFKYYNILILPMVSFVTESLIKP